MEERDRKKQAGEPEELSPEVEQDIKKGKGYTTILANIVGDVKKQAAREAQEAAAKKEKKQGFVKRFMKSLGWSNKQAAGMTGAGNQAAGDDIRAEDIISEESIKKNEIKLILSRKIYDANNGSVIKYQNKDYLVLNTEFDTDNKMYTYLLKEC